jgi:hypothetical protein
VSTAAADFVYVILGGIVLAITALMRLMIVNRDRLARLEEWVRLHNSINEKKSP